MIEDWRRALDKNLVVGIVFIFCKAFDSVSHHVLLNRLQAIVIAGDLWRWIKDYLELLSWPLSSYSRKWFSVRTFTCEVWRAKGSVLGPTLFSLFCNDLPDIVEDCDCEIHMYVTTLRRVRGCLFSWEDTYIHVHAAKIIYGLDWYTPSDQILAQSKWPSVKDLYEYILLMLAHDCFYNFLAVPIMKLFTKYESNYTTITYEGNWPFCYQNKTPKFFASPLVTKPYLYGILLTIIRKSFITNSLKRRTSWE